MCVSLFHSLLNFAGVWSVRIVEPYLHLLRGQSRDLEEQTMFSRSYIAHCGPAKSSAHLLRRSATQRRPLGRTTVWIIRRLTRHLSSASVRDGSRISGTTSHVLIDLRHAPNANEGT